MYKSNKDLERADCRHIGEQAKLDTTSRGEKIRNDRQCPSYRREGSDDGYCCRRAGLRVYGPRD